MELPINGFAAAMLLMLGFGFIIFVHELGHFLVAKWVGIRVTQFAIGFGHALVTYRKGLGLRVGSSEPEYQKRLATAKEGVDPVDLSAIGETEYRLNYLPLGGYVKMVGQEDLDPNAVSDDPRAYNNKPIWARMCVVSAGVIMNAAFAILFFILAFLPGVEFPPAEVGDVHPNTPAATTPADNDPKAIGLQNGDKFIVINGRKPSDFTDIRLASALAGPDERVSISVERPSDSGGDPTRLDFTLKPVRDPENGMLFLGIEGPETLQIGSMREGGPLNKQGVTAMMGVIAVDDQAIKSNWQLHRAVQKAGRENRSLKLTFSDGQKNVDATVTPKTELAAEVGADGHTDMISINQIGLIPATKVAGVIPGRPADGKLKVGDIIVAINSAEWPTVFEARKAIQASPGDVHATVIRDGETLKLTLHPYRGWLGFSKAQLGIELAMATDTNLITRVRQDSPLASLKLVPQARIIRINNKPVTDYTDIRHALEASGGKASVTYLLPIQPSREWNETLQLTPEQLKRLSGVDWNLGDRIQFQQQLVNQKADGVVEAAELGFQKTHLFMMQTYVTILRLFQKTVPMSEMRGPIGILDAGTTVTKRGLPYLMFFLGLISINLTVINFLPMPIVDGGLFVLLVIEKLRGKPVPPQLAGALNIAGLVMLASIFLFVTYHDISRLITG